jgi:phage terminase large subunit
MELRISLQPKQKEFRESIKAYSVSGFGGAKGGGKSYSLRNIFLARRFEYPRSTGAIFRKTFPELEANHIRPLFQEHQGLKEYWNESKKLLSLPNGSTLQFSHCTNEMDVLLYQGREINDLGIDEAGQWSESMFRTLLGSNRSSLPGVPARCALTFNPGGLGHGWIKRLFIDRKFNERERATDYHFIQALIADNKALLDNDPDYVHRLNTETSEALRKAYLYGDWDILAGQFFSELSRTAHLISPFEIPTHWNRFGAHDFGFNHPAATGWFANDQDGNTFLYREYIAAGKRVDEVASLLNRYPESKEITFFAGHDCWAKKSNTVNAAQGQNPPTIAEEFLSHGIHLRHATIDRIAGAAHLRSYLALRGEAKRPRFYIFNTCPITYDCLSRMVHDPNRVEDVLKQDAIDGDPMSGDDPYDMVRYGLMSRPSVTDPVKPKPPVGSREWYMAQNNISWDQEREKLIQQSGDSGSFPEIPDNPWGNL